MHRVVAARNTELKKPITIYFSLFTWAGTVARLTIRPLSHLYLFWAAAETTRFPPLVAASPSCVIILYALHIIRRLSTTTGCSVFFFSFFCLTENIWKTPSWIDGSWISARVRHDLRKQNAHLHPFSPLEVFFPSHLCCSIDSRECSFSLSSPSLFLYIAQDSSAVCIMDRVSSAVLSLTYLPSTDAHCQSNLIGGDKRMRG